MLKNLKIKISAEKFDINRFLKVLLKKVFIIKKNFVQTYSRGFSQIFRQTILKSKLITANVVKNLVISASLNPTLVLIT